MRREIFVFAFLFLFTMCSSRKVDDMPKAIEVPKVREKGKPLEGSLFTEDSDFINLYSDLKARKIGDIVMIRISEDVLTSLEQRKEAERQSSFSSGVNGGFAAYSLQNQAKNDFKAGVGVDSKDKFSGKGAQSNKNRFVATVAAQIIDILPSGNLIVEGEKYINHNGEIQKIYVKGIARPEDIMQDNSILSSSLANARIEYVSDGDTAKKLKDGWLKKIFNVIWPF